ncbi:septation protein IspZ [Aeromonas salmonicida]|uniref:septation protein IspZ n=1 Tax=Aeromonas salmonicida TaxID=645 RepID=UPI001040F8CA|nr:septation protein IspZ [Aeromonas salmonicida]WCH23110.1 septation protein IspZ [Aeromonas salmonicida]
MIKSVWGLYWRTYLLFLFAALPLSFAEMYFFVSESWMFLKPSLFYMVVGALLLVPFSHHKGLLFSLWGNRLGLDDIVWCSYRKVMGTSYMLCAAILYVVSETLPLTYWVDTKVYGGLFVNFVLSILVGLIVIQKKDNENLRCE